MTILHPKEHPPESMVRLRQMGFQTSPFAASHVPQLRPENQEAVCVVPGAAMASPNWPRLRVALPRANRIYVVELSECGTASVVKAMRDGAFDVVSVQDSDERWASALKHVAESQALWLRLYAGRLDADDSKLLGRSQKLRELRHTVERLGPTDVTVLLLGESGVGKERVAVALHEAGQGGPFVTLNCAAMPRELLEAELFGAEKGAFTGAHKTRVGLVEQAQGGTLFLDEIGEMDISLQPKLLRFLETRRARRVGGEQEYSVRLRVISATNRDLIAAVEAGRFRADLYYRLAEVSLRIVPLRERTEDIPELAQSFVEAANERFGKNIERLEPELVARLQQYSWPGNVRELKSVIDRLALFHEGPVLREGWWEPPVQVAEAPLSEGVTRRPPFATRAEDVLLPGRSGRMGLAKQLLASGNVSLTDVAARTGVHPTTLFRWRKSGKV